MEGNGRALPGDGRTTQTPEHEMPAYRVAARRAYREYLRTPRECYYCDKKKRLYMSPKGWFTACRGALPLRFTGVLCVCRLPIALFTCWARAH